MNYLGDSSGDLIRAVNQELAVVHSVEYDDLRGRIDVQQMIHLGLGDKCFLRAVPELDMVAVNRFEFVSVDILVAVTDCFTFSGRPDLAAFVQQHIEIVRVEHPSP